MKKIKFTWRMRNYRTKKFRNTEKSKIFQYFQCNTIINKL